MDLETVKKKLIAGSFAGLIKVLIAIPLYLILTPFVLSYLGTEMYGVWSLSTVIIGIVNLTDFGFKNSLVFFSAKHVAEPEKINRYFNVTLHAFLLISLVIVSVILTLSAIIVDHVFRVPAAYHAEAVFILNITAISFAFRILATPFQAVIEAHQDIYYSQWVVVGWMLLSFVGTLGLLPWYPSIYTLGYVHLVANIAVLLAFVLRAHRQFNFLNISPRHLSLDTLRSLFTYSVGIQLATILITLREPIYKVLVVRTQTLADVAAFEISYRLCTQIVSVAVSPLLGAFAVSALLSRRPEELEKVLRPMLGFALAVLVPGAMFFLSFSEPLVDAWLGDRAAGVSQMFPWMFLAFAIYYASETLYKAIEASGRSAYSALIQGLVMAISIGVFYIFRDDPVQAIILSLLVGFGVFTVSNMVVFQHSFPTLRLLSAGQLFVPAGLTLLYYLAVMYVPPAYLFPGFVVYLTIYLIVVLKMRIVRFG